MKSLDYFLRRGRKLISNFLWFGRKNLDGPGGAKALV
jgi:hypothetical protein